MAKYATVLFGRPISRRLQRLIDSDRTSVRSQRRVRPITPTRPASFPPIMHMKFLADECFGAEYIARECDRLGTKRRQWRVRHRQGGGREAMKQSFHQWLERTGPCLHGVYICWAKSFPLYVGYTLEGKGGPQSHVDTIWFPHVTHIEMYPTSSDSEALTLACLARHRYTPAYNQRHTDKNKQARHCPVCTVHGIIEEEVHAFSVRRKAAAR